MNELSELAYDELILLSATAYDISYEFGLAVADEIRKRGGEV